MYILWITRKTTDGNNSYSFYKHFNTEEQALAAWDRLVENDTDSSLAGIELYKRISKTGEQLTMDI